jgi:hypothetical protein
MSWRCVICDGTEWKRGVDGDGIPCEVCVPCSKLSSKRPTTPAPPAWPALDTEREEPTVPAVPHPFVREDSAPPTVRTVPPARRAGVSPKKNG